MADDANVALSELQRIAKLVSSAQQQVNQEDARDPYCKMTVEHLKSTATRLKAVVDLLKEEERVHSGGAKLDTKSDAELSRLLSSARESSGKLAVLLAQQTSFRAMAPVFTTQSGGKSLTALRIEKVHAQLNVWQDFETLNLDIKVHLDKALLQKIMLAAKLQPPQQNVYGSPNRPPGAAPSISADSCATLEQMANLAKAVSEQLGKAAKKRADHKDEQEKKKIQVCIIWETLETLLPMLEISALRTGPKMEPNHFRTFATAKMQTAHQEVEELRDRIIKEQTIREMQARMGVGGPAAKRAKR